MMRLLKYIFVFLAFTSLIILLNPDRSFSEVADCKICHKFMANKKYVHTAMQMGCTSCHTEAHQKKQKFPKGLSAASQDLCYLCHDKSKFAGKNIHMPVVSGMCSSCHDAHDSDATKLLKQPQPDICFGCHDRKIVAGKFVHVPVAAGLCTSCHGAHVSESAALLSRPINNLCITCHKDQATGRHVVSVPGKKFHPLKGVTDPNFPGKTMKVPDPKNPGKEIEVPDPKNPGKEMSCASCHNPHSSNFAKLFPSEKRCGRCHKEF
ncbi:MAG: cytochrome c3 family protein [Nitrospirota bacterium]